MSGIKQPIQDILNQLSGITIQTQENQNSPVYARVWNNQIRQMEDGKGYDFPRPAAFLEITNPAPYKALHLGFRSADLTAKIHLLHDFYNADGTLEQDLGIFDLRDIVISVLTGFCPTACGPMNCISEDQAYAHGNLYHYLLDFVCNFTDSKGSPYDPDAGMYDDTANPLLDQSTISGGIPGPIPDPDPEFIIPQ
jgi:hypothetical protein